MLITVINQTEKKRINKKKAKDEEMGLFDQWRIYKCDQDNINITNLSTLLQSQSILMSIIGILVGGGGGKYFVHHSAKRAACRPYPPFLSWHSLKSRLLCKDVVLFSSPKNTKSKCIPESHGFNGERKSKGNILRNNWKEVYKQCITFYTVWKIRCISNYMTQLPLFDFLKITSVCLIYLPELNILQDVTQNLRCTLSTLAKNSQGKLENNSSI